MKNYLDMGGYGAYVWPSYGLTAFVLLVLLVVSIRSLNSTAATYKRLQAELGLGKEKMQKTEPSNSNET